MTTDKPASGQQPQRASAAAYPPCVCGHPEHHHSEGGASCWTDAAGNETWDDSACRCDWYEPKAATGG